MKDLNNITLADIVAELQRENGARLQVYPRLIEHGKLKRDVANYRFAVLKKAITILKELDAKAKGKQLTIT